MDPVYSFHCSLPFCSKVGKETTSSITLRIIAFVSGLFLTVGALFVYKALHQFNLETTLAITISGLLVCIATASIKRIKKNDVVYVGGGARVTAKVGNLTQDTTYRMPAGPSRSGESSEPSRNSTINNNSLPHVNDTQLPLAKKSPIQKIPKNRLVARHVPLPPKIYTKLPHWSLSYLKNLPYLKFTDAPLMMKTLKKVAEKVAPAVIFSGGKTNGIALSLSVEHIALDNGQYNRQNAGPEWLRSYPLQTTKKTFDLFVVIYKRWINFNFWLLTTNEKWMEHRNGPYPISSILGNYYGHYFDDPVDAEKIEQFDNFPNQDDLPKKDRFNLVWILYRLLIKGNLKVREFPTNKLYHSLESPSIGTWSLSLNNVKQAKNITL